MQLVSEGDSILTQALGFPAGSEVKASPRNAGDLGSIPGSGRSPGERNGNPLHYSCLRSPQRSLVGYSLWGCKESDSTERLNSVNKRTSKEWCRVQKFEMGAWKLCILLKLLIFYLANVNWHP